MKILNRDVIKLIALILMLGSLILLIIQSRRKHPPEPLFVNRSAGETGDKDEKAKGGHA